MDTITVIFGVTAGGRLWGKHFGDAEQFVKYCLHPDKEPLHLLTVENKARTADEQHSSSGKLSAVMELLKPCDCVVALEISPNFRKMAAEKPLQPVVVKANSREELLRLLQQQFDRLAVLVERRRAGDRDPDVPVITV